MKVIKRKPSIELLNLFYFLSELAPHLSDEVENNDQVIYVISNILQDLSGCGMECVAPDVKVIFKEHVVPFLQDHSGDDNYDMEELINVVFEFIDSSILRYGDLLDTGIYDIVYLNRQTVSFLQATDNDAPVIMNKELIF